MLCEIFCVACGLFSFIKGERERERENHHHQFLFGAFIFAPSKAKKKAKNGRTAVALVASSAVTSTPSITILSLDIDIARADATARSTRPPRNHTTRALCSRNFDLPFRLDVFASTQFAKPFPFFPRCFSRSKNGIPIQSALMMTQKCAHRIPLFLVDATDATDARLEKIDELLFTRAKRGWSEGKKEKGKAQRTTVLCSRVKRQNKGGLFDGAFGQKHKK